MIDLKTETILRLRDARNLPWLKGREGGRLAVETLHRWALRGVHGVILESARIGSTIFTSEEALHRFIEKLSEAPLPERTSAQMKRETLAANKCLDDAGIV